jgi:ribA/ribD-fused uncharacterized protein
LLIKIFLKGKTMSEEFHFFWSGPHSNWHRSNFTHNNVTYSCGEQWMMAKKGELFNDPEIVKLILKATNPKEHKRLGRLVKNFDPVIWNANAKPIVYEGSKLRYVQNSRLLQILFDTYPKTLVEASPFDRIWGIGLAENDPRALSRDTWLGLNWLGETNTKLRNDLMRERGLI